jgi:hypothetical protein
VRGGEVAVERWKGWGYETGFTGSDEARQSRWAVGSNAITARHDIEEHNMENAGGWVQSSDALYRRYQ